jgi:hypothetical protein
MSYIEYKNHPCIPREIQEKILKIANDYELKRQSKKLRISTNKNTSELIESQTPIFDENSLGISFNDADKTYGDVICDFGFLDPPLELVEWISNNITKDYLAINLQISCNGKMLIPHIDEIRNIALNYLIDQGGDNVETVFYKPLQQYKDFDIKPLMAFPLDRIEKIYSEIILNNQWHCLDVQTIHSVINLAPGRKRIAVSISLKNLFYTYQQSM